MDMSFAERIGCLIRDGDVRAAEYELDAVAEQHRMHPVYHLSRCLLALEYEDEDAAISAAEQAIAAAEAHDSPAILAETLYVLGCSFSTAAMPERSLWAYDLVLERFGDSEEGELLEWVAKSLVNKGHVLEGSNLHGEALEAYGHVVERFAEADEVPLRAQAAQALVNRGVLLGEIGRADDELASYEQVVTWYGNAQEAPLCRWVAGALFNKGMALGEAGRRADELAAYGEVIERFGHATDLEVCEQVAKAMVNKGYRLGQMRHYEEALDAYNQVIERFGGSTDILILEQVGKALLYAGDALRALGSQEAARDAYRQVMGAFSDVPPQCLRDLASRALTATLAMDSSIGERERFIQAQDRELQSQLRSRPDHAPASNDGGPSIEDVQAFVEAHPDDAFGWATLARLHGKANRWQDAVEAWERALTVEPDLFADPLAQSAHAEEQYMEAKRRADES